MPCRAYAKTRLVYTGRIANATRLAKPFPIFQGFVDEHEDWLREEFRYKHKGHAAGTLAPTYPMFRDQVLLVALKRLNEGVEEDVTSYMYRREEHQTGCPRARAILGWELKHD